MALNLASTLSDIVAYYRFRFQEQDFKDSAALGVVMKDIKKEFLITFLFECLPQTPEWKAWRSASSRQEPYIRFMVLPELRQEFQTGETYDSASLKITDKSGKETSYRVPLNIPLVDLESLGWLGNHSYSHAANFIKPPQEPPVEPTQE